MWFAVRFNDIKKTQIVYLIKDCQWDYMEIRDGPHQGSELLGRYCASK